jgi:hypothetical protein
MIADPRASDGPMPTVEDLARPFLVGLSGLHNIVNYTRWFAEPTMEERADEDVTAAIVSDGIEMSIRVRRAIDLVSSCALSVTAGDSRGEVRLGMRRVLEQVLAIEEATSWLDFEACSRMGIE